jgi:hypothetical protein
MSQFCTNTLPAYDPMKMKWVPLEFTVSGLNTIPGLIATEVEEEDYEYFVGNDVYLKGYYIE